MKHPLAHENVVANIHVGAGHIWFPVAGILMPLSGPLSQSEAGTVVHAIKPEAVKVATETGSTPVAVCGVLSRVRVAVGPDHVESILWPPRVAQIKAEGLTRCAECHALTGKKRPA